MLLLVITWLPVEHWASAGIGNTRKRASKNHAIIAPARDVKFNPFGAHGMTDVNTQGPEPFT
jgi:hypothetical protein